MSKNVCWTMSFCQHLVSRGWTSKGWKKKKLSLGTNFLRLNLPWLRYHNTWALIRNPQIRRVRISTPIHASRSLLLEQSGTSCMQSRNFLYCVTVEAFKYLLFQISSLTFVEWHSWFVCNHGDRKKSSKRILVCKYRASMIYIFLGKTR